jgi:HPt (histidine-containing phosphotransfer) domain-containing protein
MRSFSVGVPEDLAGLDLAAALGRVGGDEDLLREIAEIFLDECPDALSEVKQAIDATDAGALQNAAHALKGSVGNFGASEAYEAALRLEMMGRNGNLTGSTEALADLERALGRLKPQLARLTAS